MKNNKVIHFLNNLELYICDVLLAITLVVATVAVIFRYVLNDSIIWSEETCRFCFVWVALLSTGYAVNNGGHLFVDVLTMFEKKIPGIVKGLNLVVDIIWVAFCIFFAKEGLAQAMGTVQLSSALQIPMSIVYGAIPVGCTFMAIRVLQKAYKEYIADRKARKAVE